MKIEIAVSCSWFQRRLCWMMSSVLQQKGDVPEIIFNVAYPKNNGNPTTEEVCEFFKNKGLNVKETVYDTEKDMQRRGLVRNKQLENTVADWILFADTDMVYHSLFFENIKKQLETTYKDETKCLAARRISLAKQHSKDFFNKLDKNKYPCVIENPDDIVKEWPVFQRTYATGAGYFQLANVKNIKDNHNGLYVNPKRCRDKPEVDAYHKTRSDCQFRKAIGGVVKMKTLSQYHLNHERDNETKKHINVQR